MLAAAWIWVDQNHNVHLKQIMLVGVNRRNGEKFLMSLILIAALLILGALLRGLSRLLISWKKNDRIVFWTRQGIRLFIAVVMILGLLSIWFNEPGRLATAFGLISAGVAFALQQVITAIAGYFVILRGKTFNVGDRIVMGGVRGDVIALGFIQTTIMEMGQPPPAQPDAPAMWVRARQYTGRIVTVSNSKIFDEPVYNYSRDFPYLWEEMMIPISYTTTDRERAERILLDVAKRNTVDIEKVSEDDLREMERRYDTKFEDLGPKVYFHLTDNWIEMSLRFIVPAHGVRDIKDRMSREIIDALDAAKIGIASGTYDIVGLPPIRIERIRGSAECKVKSAE
jgi:small-conductance mechanosensitive channel